MHCVTGWTTLDNDWEGIPLRVLAEKAKPKPEAQWVITHCDGGYTSDLSLEAMLDDDVLVAWGHGGEPLEPDHGFPLRLVVPKRYAWKSAKWLRGLEFTDQNKRGFWEERGTTSTPTPGVRSGTRTRRSRAPRPRASPDPGHRRSLLQDVQRDVLALAHQGVLRGTCPTTRWDPLPVTTMSTINPRRWSSALA